MATPEERAYFQKYREAHRAELAAYMREYRRKNREAYLKSSRKSSAAYQKNHPKEFKQSIKKYQSQPKVKAKIQERAAQWQAENPKQHKYTIAKSKAKQFLAPTEQRKALFLQYSKTTYLHDLYTWVDHAKELVDQLKRAKSFSDLDLRLAGFDPADRSNPIYSKYGVYALGAARLIGYGRSKRSAKTVELAFELDRKRYLADIQALIDDAQATISNLL